ncbi:LLM class flavin-dependent oxidoreductase [Streptomyces sp. NPDC054940]
MGGGGPTWDSFVLAAAIGRATEQVALTAGPVAVSVRDAFGIARGAASVAAVTGRRVGVALGTSSKRVVEGVHGVPRMRPAAAMEASAAAVRGFLPGRPGEPVAPRQRLPAPPAAAHADRRMLEIVSPEQVRRLRAKLEAAATRAGRTSPPTLASWLPAAVDPARTGADSGTLVRALPAEAAGSVGLVGWTPYARVSRSTPRPGSTRSPSSRRRRAIRAGNGR